MTRKDLRKPDQDPDELRAAAVKARIDEDPAAFRDARELAREVGSSASDLADLLSRHYHATPAELLIRARLDHARRALFESGREIAEIAADTGFTSAAAFERDFRRRLFLEPREYRALRGTQRFELALPKWYSSARALAYLGRDPKSLVQQVDGKEVRFAVRNTAVAVRLSGRRAEVEWTGGKGDGIDGRAEIHRRVLRLLGLGIDPQPFERRMEKEPETARLIAGQHGLTVPQTHDVADGLVWVIVGQQVSLASAFAIRGRLVRRFGRRVADGLHQPPDLGAVAQSDLDELRSLGLSGRKAEYLLGLARQVSDSELDLPSLERAPATRIERRLLACRGLGPWSVHYLMMRSFGLADCVPAGDVALAESLKRHFMLEQRPNPEETRRLMGPFAPHRSLATFHFWSRLGDAQ